MRTLYYLYGLIALVFVGLAGTASASFTGPCTATVNGADLKQEEVVNVPAGSMLEYSFTAEQPVRSYLLAIRFGIVDATPSSGVIEDSDQTTVAGTVDLAEYAWMGVGLYTVDGQVVLADGSDCKGSININVEGNPLTTAVGGGAAVVTGITTAALIAMFLKGSGLLFAA